MESSQLLQLDKAGFTLCPAGHRGKTKCCCQGPFFAAAESHCDGTSSYMASPTEELNFNQTGEEGSVSGICLLGSVFFSEPKAG